MIAVSHPTGNEFVRALLTGLENRGLLARFFTTLDAPGEKVLALLPSGVREQLRRRAYDLPKSKIITRPVVEIGRLLGNALDFPRLSAHGAGWASIDRVYDDLDRVTAAWVSDHWREIKAVHCYEDGAEATFRAAASHGVRRVYELPIAYWETTHRVLGEEAERLPEWEPTLFATRDGHEKLERKTSEAELADVVVCPSQFVLDSLPEKIRASKKCIVAEFGSPTIPALVPRKQSGEKLRVLFAGAMTQRKGLADVFAAMKLLKRSDVELVVMGSPVASMEFYRRQHPAFIHEPPRPHDSVMALMQTCDVLVLPSLVEGRALVQQEALACGLPLIVTPNAGGEDLIEENTGFLVPIRAPDKIAEKLEWFAEHRGALPEFRTAAVRKAKEYTWDEYARSIIEAQGDLA